MPAIRPFRGIHYDFDRFRDLTALVAPPYDAIDPAYRDRLEERDPYNVVRLELEKERPGDGGAENRYSRSGRWFQEWLARRILVRDPKPALYVLHQRFELGGQPLVRKGFFARLPLHPFSEGVVLPHERSRSGPREDRFELYKAVRANVSPIFAVYPDDAGEVQSLLEPAVLRDPDATAATDLDQTRHSLWRVEDPAVIKAVSAAMAQRRIYIADGHNRYETALAYARWCEEELGAKGDGAHRTILACLSGMNDPGLRVLPTHRLVRGVRVEPEKLLALLDEHFDVETLVEDVGKPAGRAWALRRLAEAGRAGHAVVMLAHGQKARLLRLKEGVDLAHVTALPKNPTLRSLDVTLVQGLILQHTLGIAPEAQEDGETVRYLRDADEVVAKVASGGQGDVGFLLNATPMWQVRAVAEAGEVMFPMSTWFYPKVPTGLVFQSIEPSEPA